MIYIYYIHRYLQQEKTDYIFWFKIKISLSLCFIFIKAFNKVFRDHKKPPIIDRAWLASTLIIIVSHLTDITYYDGKISISEGSKILAEFNATYDELAEKDIEFEEENDFYISELTEDGPIFYGKNQEKGTFFFTEMKIENFDISKISIETVDIEEIEIVSKVLYDGKELKNLETQTKSLGELELSFEN